jgi:hypothetical protein
MKRAAALALVVLGCGGAPERVSLGDPQRALSDRDYVDQLKRWTRHGHVIADFDDALDVNATLRSPEFRAAYAEKYLKVYRVEPETQPKVRGELISDGADTFEFHVESAAHDYDINDFTSAKSIWRVTLVDDQGHEVKPIEIVPDKARRQAEIEFYPYAGIFARGWRMRFPRARLDGTPLVGAGTKSLMLRIAGPPGTIELVWLLI